MATLYVGLDLALQRVACCFLLEDGTEPVPRFTLPHTPEGVSQLVEKIRAVSARYPLTALSVGMESTGLLWWHLSEALRTQETLQSLHPQVFVLNAKWVAHFKKAYPEQSKTDPADAFVIADRLRFGRLPVPSLPDERYLALQKLTRHRFHLVQSLASEKNRFLTHLFLKFSGFCQEAPLSDPFGAAASALLTESLSVEDIAQMPLEALTDFLRQKSRNHLPQAPEVAQALRQAARNSYRLPACLKDPVNLVLTLTLQNIRFFQRQIATLDQVIARELAAFPQALVLLSVPGLGPVFTAGLLAEVQDIHRFDSDAKLAKLAALAWKQTQSGPFQGDETPLLHSGNHYLRYYLIEAANSLRRHNDEYRAYYQVKFRETPKHPHQRALVLTARKLVRLLYALLRTEQLYQLPASRKETSAAAVQPTRLTPAELTRQIVRHRRARHQAQLQGC